MNTTDHSQILREIRYSELYDQLVNAALNQTHKYIVGQYKAMISPISELQIRCIEIMVNQNNMNVADIPDCVLGKKLMTLDNLTESDGSRLYTYLRVLAGA